MKKFDLKGVKGVFANLRGGDKNGSKGDVEVQESLRPHDFFCGKLMRHGFPYQPTCIAWDPIQKLLAVGTKQGAVRLLGRPGVDITVNHETKVVVLQVTFLINEGAFITVCSDDSIHLWSYRQKSPEIVHSLKFSRERITCLHLPFQSKWLYLGSERGNVHIVNVETFTVCGYTINWNKAIELARKTHPGPVVHLSDNPLDPNKLLIGYETGLIVCWDLKCKMAEYRFHSAESLRDACWHQEGRLFMCSHADGTITTWNFKQQTKPVSIISPHSKANKEGKTSPCKPINKLAWKTIKNGEPYVIFSGGMSYDSPSRSPSLTIMQGKSITVLEMEHQIIDFIVLCNSVWQYEYHDPYAIIVLLSSDLIFVDMTTPGYPCFQCPYALDIHESPVTSLKYYSDCASDLIPAFYSCGSKQKRKGFSEKEFPVSGGQWGSASCSYFELLITGHSDGTLKFWDVSGINLQFLYRLKTNKLFEKVKSSAQSDINVEDVLSIQHIYLDEESRLLAVAASHYVILFSFSKKESTKSPAVIEVTALNEVFEETNDPFTQENPSYTNPQSNTLDSKEVKSAVKAKSSPRKYTAGYQPDLITLVQWCAGCSPPLITCLCINSSYGLMAIGTSTSLIIVDLVQKSCIMNILPTDLYNSYMGKPTNPIANSQAMTSQQIPAAPVSPKLRNSTAYTDDMYAQSSRQDDTQSKSSDQNGNSSPGPTIAKQRFRWKNVAPDRADGAFSRSRSSSMNSLEAVGNDTIQFVMFADGYTRRHDLDTTPGLWIGTNNGSIFPMNINLPGSERATQPVVISQSGSLFQLKGSILELCFLGYNGLMIPVEAEVWNGSKEGSTDKREKRLVSRLSRTSVSTAEQVERSTDKHIAVICTDSEIRSISLPSQNTSYKEKITDGMFIVKASAIIIKDSVSLACLASNGNILVYSLPSLKPLLNVKYINEFDVRISRTFDFGNHGHGTYMCTATELQKFTISADMCRAQSDMQCEAFVAKDNPEPPKQSFLKNLFGSGPSVLDRQELFGTSGKASHGVATFLPGTAMQAAQANAAGVASEVARTRQALDERGEKLSQLDKRTELMKERAREFSNNAAMLANKYKDSKWYQM